MYHRIGACGQTPSHCQIARVLLLLGFDAPRTSTLFLLTLIDLAARAVLLLQMSSAKGMAMDTRQRCSCAGIGGHWATCDCVARCMWCPAFLLPICINCGITTSLHSRRCPALTESCACFHGGGMSLASKFRARHALLARTVVT